MNKKRKAKKQKASVSASQSQKRAIILDSQNIFCNASSVLKGQSLKGVMGSIWSSLAQASGDGQLFTNSDQSHK